MQKLKTVSFSNCWQVHTTSHSKTEFQALNNGRSWALTTAKQKSENDSIHLQHTSDSILHWNLSEMGVWMYPSLLATMTILPQKSLNSSLEKWLTCTTGHPSIAHSCSIYTHLLLHTQGAVKQNVREACRWVYNHKWVMEYEYWFVVSLTASERPERFSGLLNIRTALQVSAALREPPCEVVWRGIREKV